MSRITWDAIGERLFEVGLDHGVLYFPFQDGFVAGVPWNGLTSVTGPEGGHSASPLYSGDVKTENVYSSDEFSGSIKAYTYPPQLEEFFGESEVIPGVIIPHQDRKRFGFSYRTLKGNDVDGTNHGYKIHLVYNAEIIDFPRSYSSMTESLDVEALEWKYECFPIEYESYKPFAEVVFDSTKYPAEIMTRLENIIYGTSDESPRLPTIDEIFSLFAEEVYPSDDLYPSGLEYHGGQWMIPKTITANGAYSPEDDDVDGYSSVLTRVRPDFTIVDELPPVGEENAFYYMYEEGVFNEYMYIDGEWELTGEKELPVSAYSHYISYELTYAEILEIVNS